MVNDAIYKKRPKIYKSRVCSGMNTIKIMVLFYLGQLAQLISPAIVAVLLPLWSYVNALSVSSLFSFFIDKLQIRDLENRMLSVSNQRKCCEKAQMHS